MSIFKLHDAVIEDYSKYIQSFFSIADERIRNFIEEALIRKRELWLDVLIQLNLSYQYASTVDQLVMAGKLNNLCGDIFRHKNGTSIRLFRHQQEAIEKALEKKHFVITSGTGSGKTLTYLTPIFHRVASEPPDGPRVKAIIVYPMNARVNSPYEALVSLSEQYKKRTGRECPVRFKKYTGQENIEQKQMLLQYVQKQGRFTQAQAAELCQLGPAQACRLLKSLKRCRLLVSRGQKKAHDYDAAYNITARRYRITTRANNTTNPESLQGA